MVHVPAPPPPPLPPAPRAARRGARLVTALLAVAALATAGALVLRQGVGHAASSAPAAPAARVAAPAPVTTGHARMVATLRSIADKAERDNAFIGQNGIEILRNQAKALETGVDERSTQVLFTLGNEELRLGNPEAAVAAFQHVRENVRGRASSELVAGAAFHYGVACMRLGESQNCVARHTSESCIFPIGGSGVHVAQEGSRAAMGAFTELLGMVPNDLPARWLLNVAAMTLGEWPDGVPEAWRITPEDIASDEPFPRFKDVAPGLKLNTHDLAGGAIVEDLDGDELLDVVVSTMDPTGQMHAFRNVGDGSFVDRTAEANLTGLLGGLNMNQADYDGDGDVDILVLRGAWLRSAGRYPNSLLRNDGHGVFEDVTYAAGLADVSYPTQAAGWSDYDRDGDLDLYVGNEVGDEPYPSQLFRNEGDGTFTDVATSAGVSNLRFAKGVSWGDYDQDGWPDIYVSNLGSDNRLYRNRGDGTFDDVAPKLGVTGPQYSFPAWFWDFDNDGALDIFVSSYPEAPGPQRVAMATASLLGKPHEAELSALYEGDGRGGFRDVAVEQGLTRVAFAMGSNFGDLDNDGWLDFYLGTGFPQYEGIIPNVMYHNREGRRFADVTTAGGFGNLQKGHAVAFADVDGDGDQDVFEQMGGAFKGDGFGNVLYENPGFPGHWLALRLVGTASNRSAIGARIRATFVDGGATRSIVRWVNSGGSFGASSLRQHLGLGSATSVKELEITWPKTGETQVFHDVPADRAFRITEGESSPAPLSIPSFRLH